MYLDLRCNQQKGKTRSFFSCCANNVKTKLNCLFFFNIIEQGMDKLKELKNLWQHWCTVINYFWSHNGTNGLHITVRSACQISHWKGVILVWSNLKTNCLDRFSLFSQKHKHLLWWNLSQLSFLWYISWKLKICNEGTFPNTNVVWYFSFIIFHYQFITIHTHPLYKYLRGLRWFICPNGRITQCFILQDEEDKGGIMLWRYHLLSWSAREMRQVQGMHKLTFWGQRSSKYMG